MTKGIKIMLLPNKKQEFKLYKTASAARYAYNWTLATQMKQFEEAGEYMSELEIRRLFTLHKQENPWLYDVSNNASKQAIKDCCNAFSRFIEEKKKRNYKPYSKEQIANVAKHARILIRYNTKWHPKFKKKNKSEPKFYVDTDKIEFSDTHVKLEKIADSKRENRLKANWVKLAEKDRAQMDAKYVNPRVKFDGVHWWISVGIETESELSELSSDGMGIDVGVKDLAICSDETVYKNINKSPNVRKIKKKQRRLQHKVSRKYEMNKSGEEYKKTRNIKKAEKRNLQIYQRLTNIRHNHVHQTTSEIVERKPSFIALGDLNIQGMMKNKHISKAVQEQCLYEFSRQIQYKSESRGIKIVKVNRYYPSSKTCSVCGGIKSNLKLSERTYVCPKCRTIIDRDLNAALNLKAYGEQFA